MCVVEGASLSLEDATSELTRMGLCGVWKSLGGASVLTESVWAEAECM